MMEQAYGYANNICWIDLTTRKVVREKLDSDLARNLIGGFGINNQLAWDRFPVGLDPLSPENGIILGSGPFCGTLVPSNSRMMATTKFPLSGQWASTSGGGNLAYALKQAGYDHVIITGKSETPVYLKLAEEVEILPAENLWGKDLFETTDALWDLYYPCGVMAIGPAGENLVLTSLTMLDKVGSLGKGGLGAIMGSKNLKAVVATGSRPIKVHDPERFLKSVEPLFDRMKKDHIRDWWTREGHMTGWFVYTDNRVPYANWSRHHPEEKLKDLYDADFYLNKVKKAPIACMGCGYADKHLVEVPSGPHAGLCTAISHYLGPVLYIGARLDIPDYADQLKICDLCNRMGLDEQAVGGVINFAVQLYQEGILSKEDTDGMELVPGFATVQTLVEKIARREGFGEVLADGVLSAARKIGRGAEDYAVHIKGMEYLIDGRCVLNPEAFGEVVNPRGHQIAAESITMGPGVTPETVRRFNQRIGVPPEAQEQIFADGMHVGLEARYVEDWWAVASSLPVCFIHPVIRMYNLELMAELYSSLTGIEISPEELIRAGERGLNLQRALNVRDGFSREEDVFPEAWFKPLPAGDGSATLKLMDYYKNRELTREDAYKLLDDYYENRGWDIETGIPTQEKLRELGLDRVADGLKDKSAS
ncbi:aldehyde ferredoxin oxidoreductase family protein [Thermodesulfobacteriota bacterium]